MGCLVRENDSRDRRKRVILTYLLLFFMNPFWNVKPAPSLTVRWEGGLRNVERITKHLCPTNFEVVRMARADLLGFVSVPRDASCGWASRLHAGWNFVYTGHRVTGTADFTHRTQNATVNNSISLIIMGYKRDKGKGSRKEFSLLFTKQKNVSLPDTKQTLESLILAMDAQLC